MYHMGDKIDIYDAGHVSYYGRYIIAQVDCARFKLINISNGTRYNDTVFNVPISEADMRAVIGNYKVIEKV